MTIFFQAHPARGIIRGMARKYPKPILDSRERALLIDLQTEFEKFTKPGPVKQGISHLELTHAWLKGAKNRDLLKRWRDFSLEMADRFAVADPKLRAHRKIVRRKFR